ncbi:hypothetical protein Daus18300_004293 [Diaporthe australafricana]|uniref:FAD-binding domain-containing protein n=1 Tax=Diaporthe australafricana TaxID=127596 RepID=A0ABR3X9V1_9PEZI
MATLKVTELLLEGAKAIVKKRDTIPSRTSDASNEYHGHDSSHSSDHAAIPANTNTNSRKCPITHIPTITLNNDEVPLLPSYSASSDTYIDIADSIPLLDLHPLRANPTARPAQTTESQAQLRTHTQPPGQQPPPFRAIIVGGGPDGLILAHALHLAGIDYTLLERSPTMTPEHGHPLVLRPASLRILDQLGLLATARERSTALRTTHTHRADGTLRGSSESHGHPRMLVDRAGLLRLLWEALQERESRVRTGREVVSVETLAAGVRVVCADGAVEEGEVVLGCDGMHGVVRAAVCDLGAARRSMKMAVGGLGLAALGGSDEKAGGPVKAKYYGLIGSSPLLDGLEPGVCYETRSDPKGKIIQVLVGEEAAYFLVYVRLAKPTHERTRYTQHHAEQLASTLAEHPVTEKIKFGDLWRARRWGKMVDFHEGLARKWYHERAVLVGGAAHKLLTPSLSEPNAGWQDAGELINGLRRLVMAQGQSPDTASIERVFREYEYSRMGLVRRAVLFSALYTRPTATRSLMFRFCDWVTPVITLDFAEEKHDREAKAKGAKSRALGLDAASAREARERERRIVWVYPGYPITVN